jgi:hypothetical protein
LAMPASLLDMRLWRNSKNDHTHITLRLLPRDRGDLVRVGVISGKTRSEHIGPAYPQERTSLMRSGTSDLCQ